jgi:hypothetical protein
MMNKKIMFMILVVIGMTNNSLVSGSGWNDYSVLLPNGYKLVRTNDLSIFIFRPHLAEGTVVEKAAVVPPKIVALNISDDIVFGRTEDAPGADDWGRATPGFFILDTKNHKIQLGLDKDKWLVSLRALGINEEPTLEKPSKHFKGAGIQRGVSKDQMIKELESEKEVLQYIIIAQGQEIERLRTLCEKAGIDIKRKPNLPSDPNLREN